MGDGWLFGLVNQPARSLDLNICDLSICNVLQTLQFCYVDTMTTVSDIIDSVNYAWAKFDHVQLEKAFCTLTMVFECVILNHGSNDYALPHLDKDAIIRREGIVGVRAHARQASQTAIDIVVEFFGENI